MKNALWLLGPFLFINTTFTIKDVFENLEPNKDIHLCVSIRHQIEFYLSENGSGSEGRLVSLVLDKKPCIPARLLTGQHRMYFPEHMVTIYQQKGRESDIFYWYGPPKIPANSTVLKVYSNQDLYKWVMKNREHIAEKIKEAGNEPSFSPAQKSLYQEFFVAYKKSKRKKKDKSK